MKSFLLPLEVRWSDIDANRHVRHSAYYDYGAYCRMVLFTQIGLSIETLKESNLGPILFREEAVFKREIIFGDKLFITMELTKATEDYSRWSFRHSILKEDETVAAIISVDGAWIDLEKRKLGIPSSEIQNILNNIPRAKDFTEQELTSK
jgi:acyl-CoA thioester hydrolase